MPLSDFLPTAHFGIFVSASILLALYYDLFVLPLVLKGISRWGKKRLGDFDSEYAAPALASRGVLHRSA